MLEPGKKTKNKQNMLLGQNKTKINIFVKVSTDKTAMYRLVNKCQVGLWPIITVVDTIHSYTQLVG